MLLAEDLLLLVTDDISGRLSAPAAQVDVGLGGANLVELTLLNKVDLLPYVPFRMDLAREYIRRVQPDAEIVEVSCTTGAGLDTWRRWIDARAAAPVSVF